MTAIIHSDLIIQPRDPILLRDGRPFTAEPGGRAQSLPWPLPSTLAGAIRTHIGNSLNFKWSLDGPEQALAIGLTGALPVVRTGTDWEVYVPAPHDALYVEGARGPELAALRPAIDTVTDCLPTHEKLNRLSVTDERKPATVPHLWPLSRVCDWLSRDDIATFDAIGASLPTLETRIHVGIGSGRTTADPGRLFSTQMRVFSDASGIAGAPPEMAIFARVAAPDGWEPSASVLTIGGERRLAYVSTAPPNLWPSIPANLDAAVRASQGLRLQLITPAIFIDGWKPDWLNDDLEGSPPADPSLRLRLVSVVLGRSTPVSGWNLHNRKSGAKPGPKPARYAAPAGTVYFFEVLSTCQYPANLFLTSICEDPKTSQDGFGLTIPGIWNLTILRGSKI